MAINKAQILEAETKKLIMSFNNDQAEVLRLATKLELKKSYEICQATGAPAVAYSTGNGQTVGLWYGLTKLNYTQVRALAHDSLHKPTLAELKRFASGESTMRLLQQPAVLKQLELDLQADRKAFVQANALLADADKLEAEAQMLLTKAATIRASASMILASKAVGE